MADRVDLDSKISPEGRVVIPAAVRRALGVRAGDRVRFILEGDQVRVVSSRALAFDLWAKNTGGDTGDSGRSVRAARQQDQAAGQARWDRVAEAVAASDSRTDEEIAQDLFRALGI